MLSEHNMIGKDLEDYHIVTELSSDSSCRTFVGESISLKTAYKLVFIKLLDTAHALSQEERQSVIQAFPRIQQLHHPHILPILSTGLHKDIPYIITEYIAASSLHDLLQGRPLEQPMPLEEALFLLTQIGEALHYAHQQGVIHGSLKPQNVLIRAPDHVFLTDFHLHTLLLPDRRADTGSFSDDLFIYLAPEQVPGPPSQKSDQYALGCLAYAMLTGAQPFMVPSTNTPGKYYRTKSLIPPRQLNPALPSEMEEAILKAMSREPAERYDHISDFLAAMNLFAAVEKRDQNNVAVGPVLPITPIPTTDVSETKAVKGEYFHDEETSKMEASIAVGGPSPWQSGAVKPVESWKPFSSEALRSYLSSTLPTKHVPKRLTRMQTVVVILCLIALAAGTVVALISFNQPTPSKGLAATPSPRRTVIAQAPPPTSMPATSTPAPSPTATATPQDTSSSPKNYPVTPTPGPTPPPTSNSNSNPASSSTPVPTPAPTPTPTASSSCTGNFTQGVVNSSSSSAVPWFEPCSWTAGYVILHYTVSGQTQQDVNMTYNSSTKRWGYTVNGLSSGQSLTYSFTYQQNEIQYDTSTYIWTHP